MLNYEIFGKYYDAFMNFTNTFNDFMNRVLLRYPIDTETVLEIACGTGKNLLYFSKSKHLYGLDISPEMLKSAKLNVPQAKFLLRDMTNFQIGHKFQLILCMFDSINHLKDYSQWLSTFQSVYDHLSKDGYFIFDINTTYALNLPITKRTMFRQHNSDYLVMQYYNSGVDQASWDLQFFIHRDTNMYEHYSETIMEKSYDITVIKENLLTLFSSVDVLNGELEVPLIEENRVFFICHK